MDNSSPDPLIPILDLGSAAGARGRKAPRDVSCEVVRALTPGDIPALRAPAPPRPANITTYLRSRHQQLAQLVARGLSEVEICALTSYSQPHLSTLLNHDAAFQALVAHYQAQTEIAFTDLTERMRVLGISAVEELQARIDSEPDKWTKGELISLMEQVTKGIATSRGALSAPQSSAPVTVNLNFVKSETRLPRPDPIDLEPTNVS